MPTKIQSDLKHIAEHLPSDASYADVMYELYVRMKIAKGKQSIRQGRVVPHEVVKRKFIK